MDSEVAYINLEDFTYQDLIKYKYINVDIPDILTHYILQVQEIQSKNKKTNTNWKRNNTEKTNWLVTNRMNQTDNDKLISQFRGILNKISEGNFDDMMKQMFKLNITTIEQLQTLVDLIFQKALGESIFGTVYSMLCKEFFSACIIVDSEKIQFRVLFMNKCELMFDEYIKIKTEKDIKESCFVNKTELIGLMAFLGDLYNKGLISNSIIYRCILSIVEKVNSNDIASIECICKFIETVSYKFNKTCPDNHKEIFEILIEIKQRKGLPTKDKFAIMDVLEGCK